MPYDANLLLVNNTDMDSSDDGNGSGSDATVAAGAVLSVAEETELGVVLQLGQPSGGDPAGDADTIDVIIQGSADGGSSWDPLATFRTVLGSEIPDDEAAGDKSKILAAKIRTPRADSGQSNLAQIRANIVCSDTSDWSVRIDIGSPNDLRTEWMQDALVA